MLSNQRSSNPIKAAGELVRKASDTIVDKVKQAVTGATSGDSSSSNTNEAAAAEHSALTDHSVLNSAFASRFVAANTPIPKYELPKTQMPSRAAYNIIREEMMFNSNPNMNLASFVTTTMEEEAEKLMMENINVNLADQNVYPQTTELQHRCVSMLSHLYHARDEGANAVGTATIGSSEGIMLGLLAMLGRWRKREQKRTGKDPLEEADANGKIRKPNYICSASSHVTVLKFGRYWNVEARVVPFEKGVRHLTPEQVLSRIDENTIGIVSVIGTQLTGEVDNVRELHDAVVDHCGKKGWDFVVPFHIDGASGGFTIPFTHPEHEFDFRLPHVASIQCSGHKYGLVYPGIGWVLWRSKEYLPEDLVFHINYLGSDESSFALNFSRPATQIIGQYYNFLRLGYEGYERIAKQCHDNAKYLTSKLEKLGYFDFYSDLSKASIPVVAFGFNDKLNYLDCDELVNLCKTSGWTVPKYTLPPNQQELTIFRAVVRESFTRDMADYLVHDIQAAVEHMQDKVEKLGIKQKLIEIKQQEIAKVKGEASTDESRKESYKAEAAKGEKHEKDHPLGKEHQHHHMQSKHGKARASAPRPTKHAQVVQTVC